MIRDDIASTTDGNHETVIVSSRSISCNGGGGALGHPLVYLMIGADGWRDCGYCGRRFVLSTGNR